MNQEISDKIFVVVNSQGQWVRQKFFKGIYLSLGAAKNAVGQVRGRRAYQIKRFSLYDGEVVYETSKE